jgi:hypothetical protein
VATSIIAQKNLYKRYNDSQDISSPPGRRLPASSRSESLGGVRKDARIAFAAEKDQ